MFKKTVAALALALVPFAATPAHAADPAQVTKELQRLVGSWKGTGTLTMRDGKVLPAQVTYDCKSGSGGAAVRCQLAGTVAGLPPIASEDLFGFNADDGLVHWFTVTNMGETHDHKGGFENGTFTGLYEGPQAGQLFQEQISIQLVNDKKVRVRSASKLGDKSLESLDVTFTKS